MCELPRPIKDKVPVDHDVVDKSGVWALVWFTCAELWKVVFYFVSDDSIAFIVLSGMCFDYCSPDHSAGELARSIFQLRFGQILDGLKTRSKR